MLSYDPHQRDGWLDRCYSKGDDDTQDYQNHGGSVDTLVYSKDGTVISGDTAYAEEVEDAAESCLGREAYAEERLHAEVMASLERQTRRRPNQVLQTDDLDEDGTHFLGIHDPAGCEVTVSVAIGPADAATWEREERCQRCCRIPANRTFFRQVAQEGPVMICSVCRLCDACQTSWKTQSYSTDDEQEIKRRLTEVLQAMV